MARRSSSIFLRKLYTHTRARAHTYTHICTVETVSVWWRRRRLASTWSTVHIWGREGEVGWVFLENSFIFSTRFLSSSSFKLPARKIVRPLLIQLCQLWFKDLRSQPLVDVLKSSLLWNTTSKTNLQTWNERPPVHNHSSLFVSHQASRGNLSFIAGFPPKKVILRFLLLSVALNEGNLAPTSDEAVLLMRRVYCLMLHLHTRALTLLYPVGGGEFAYNAHTLIVTFAPTHTHSLFQFAKLFPICSWVSGKSCFSKVTEQQQSYHRSLSNFYLSCFWPPLFFSSHHVLSSPPSRPCCYTPLLFTFFVFWKKQKF